MSGIILSLSLFIIKNATFFYVEANVCWNVCCTDIGKLSPLRPPCLNCCVNVTRHSVGPPLAVDYHSAVVRFKGRKMSRPIRPFLFVTNIRVTFTKIYLED